MLIAVPSAVLRDDGLFVRWGQKSHVAELSCQWRGNPRSTAEGNGIGQDFSPDLQILICDSITDQVDWTRMFPSLNSGIQFSPDPIGPCQDGCVMDRTNAVLCLACQPSDEVGIGHGVERMVFHAAFIQQFVADEQMSVEDPAVIFRQGWKVDKTVAPQRGGERVAHRADVAIGRRIKGGAVFELQPRDPESPQGRQCCEGL